MLRRSSAENTAMRVQTALIGLSLLTAASLSGQTTYAPYTVTTLAGMGDAGRGSADGQESAARFYEPSGIAVDGAGNMYVADSGNHTIRKFMPNGVVMTFAGSPGLSGSADGVGSAARFYFPYGIAVDGAGNVYVADSGNSTIRKITPDEVVTTLAGTAGTGGGGIVDGTGSAARFYAPEGVAVDGAGNVYVTDNCAIRKVTPDGVVTTFAGIFGGGEVGSTDGTGTAARFNSPLGIAVDNAGVLYVADCSNDTIRKITPDGVVTTLAGAAGMGGDMDGTGSQAHFSLPSGITVDDAGNLYVVDNGPGGTIRKITPGGVVTTLAGQAEVTGSANGMGSAARFFFDYGFTLVGVAVDGTGNLYVADRGNDEIRKITSNGLVTTLAGAVPAAVGSSDGTGSAAQFDEPSGVAVDGAGNVYVADMQNNVIRKITSGGVVTTLAGTAGPFGGSADGAGSAAQFYRPWGVAVDGNGNVYVADSGYNTIRKVTPDGVVTTLAGTPTLYIPKLDPVPGSIDGTGSKARFYQPSGIAVDGFGNVYVADTGNSTIRKITPGGAVTTLAGYSQTTGSADGTGSAARFNYPQGVAVDEYGNVYVADSWNNMVRKITPSGIVTTLAGTAGVNGGSSDGTGSAARFNQPNGVAVDGAGNVYVADTLNNTIRRITPAAVVTTLIGTPGAAGSSDGIGSGAQINSPEGVAVDVTGNISVADFGNNTIRKGTSVSPVIATQPQSFVATAGTTTSFSVGASGAATLDYQWFFNNQAIAGATEASYTITNVQASNAGSYTVVVFNTVGTVESNPTTLTVAPLITVEPQPQTAVAGTTAAFSVTAIGATGYQWVFNGAGISGATNATLTLTNVTASQAGSYTVYVFCGSSYIESSAAALSVLPTPVITSAINAETYLGGALLYTCTASNSPTIFGIEGSLPPGCVFNPATGVISGSPTSAGTYSVTILADNGYGVGSTPLRITVDSSPTTTLTSLVLAGNPGINGYGAGSTDGTGSNAQFFNPLALTADGSGIVYVADTGNNTIRKITPDGTVTTIAGTAGVTGALDGTGAGAQFNAPSAIVVDATGNLFVADTNNSTIRKITPAGVVTTLAGLPGVTGISNGNGPAALFHRPKGIAIDPNGVLYVSDTGNRLVRKVTSSGVVTTVATSGSIVLSNPTGIAVDGSGTIFVLDSGNYGVLKIAPSGTVSLLAYIYLAPLGIALDSSGNLYSLANEDVGGGLYLLQLVQITPVGANRLSYSSAGSLTGAIATDPEGGFFTISGNAVFTVSPAAPPSITVQPQSQSIAVGGQGTLSVTATGVPSPTYQWQFNGSTILGATNSTLGLSNMSLSGAGAYTVVVSNASGAVTSDPAVVTVTSNATGPTITFQPLSETVAVGTPAIFSVTATGNGDSFQWLKNGITIAGATGSACAIPSAQAGNGGDYSVLVTNAGGTVTSAPVHLGVNVAPGITNLSTWTSAVGLPTGTQYTSVAFDGSSYMAAGSDGSLLVSTGGTSWAASASAPGRLNSLIYAGAPYGFLGVGDNGVILSAAGPSYAPLLQTSGSSSLLTGIAVGNGRMVAIGFSGSALSSAFAVPAWAPGVTGVTANLNAVAFGKGTFVAVGLGGTVITSADGLLWTQKTLGAATDLYSVACGPAGFVAIGNNGSTGAIFTSPDGTTWTSQPSSTTNTLIRVIFADGTFVAAGAPGVIIFSTDGGFTWGAASTSTGSTLEGVTFGTNSFTAVGSNGVVAQSGAFAAPAITTQPGSQTVTLGGTTTLTVAASGASLTYQWSLNGTPISGATLSSYTINSAAPANVGSYTVKATNSAGSVTSNGGVLAVQANGAPAIVFQPQSQTMAVGSTLVMTVGSSGTVTVNSDSGSELRAKATTGPSYQWYLNGVAISGGTSAILELSYVSSATAGTYSCLVSNASGSTLSNPATVAVTATTDPGRMINLSTLAEAGSGSQLLTVGFFTGGAGTTGSQPLLVQALGPVMATLVAPGVKVMPDPQLNVFSGQTIIGSNAGWGTPLTNQQAVTAADTATGATALADPSSKDSATLVALPPGGYTVQVGSVSGVTGTTLTAFYDDTPSGAYSATTPRLINISCRLQVAANGSLTAGFWIGGATSKTVLIRADGPALLAQNVTGVMPDPQLTVYNAAENVIAYNAGWGGSPILSSVAASVYAQPLTSTTSNDSEVLLTLPPGGYTAQVSSVSNTAGDVMIEVYEVP
jgi:sugar lactone lactonase YvrE